MALNEGRVSAAAATTRTLPGHPAAPANLADILERVLVKGIVIAGDIQINLLDVELLTIKLRLLIASVDGARQIGINPWQGHRSLQRVEPLYHGQANLADENRELRDRI